MSELNSWKYSTVREFLEIYNWSGQELAKAAASDSHSAVSATVAWQRQTVQTFFSQLNWLGLPVEQQEFVSSPQQFSTRLTVKDFFQFFTWEGQPNIATIPDIPKSSPIKLEDDLNLNDFSDMF